MDFANVTSIEAFVYGVLWQRTQKGEQRFADLDDWYLPGVPNLPEVLKGLVGKGLLRHHITSFEGTYYTLSLN